MLHISSRIPIITALTFVIALVVSYQPNASEPLIFNAPMGLIFSMGCSVFLVVYYLIEVFFLQEESK